MVAGRTGIPVAVMEMYGSPAHGLPGADEKIARMAALGKTKGLLSLRVSFQQWPMADVYRRVERQGKYSEISP